MKTLIWLVLLGIFGGFGYAIWSAMRRYDERKRAAEERFASFIAQTAKPSAPRLDPAAAPAQPAAAAPAPDLGVQKLLFDAAFKASEAGEPGLSMQLYMRLIERYPAGVFAAQARAAAEKEKAKLARS